MRPLILIPVAALLCVAGAFTAAIALSRPSPPPPMASMEAAGETLRGWAHELSPNAFVTAKDGTRLAYRFYQGRPDGGVVVAIHGTTGLSASMDGVARALQGIGMSVYAIDLRGHGESGPLGDIGYRGQLEDDMAVMLHLIATRQPKEKRLLVGHSMGGAFALRVASGRLGDRFDAYIATSPPLLAADPSLGRPNSGGWVDVAVPRIIALSILSSFGISIFDGLPAIAYAVPPDAPGKRASIYSYRLLANMSLPRDWQTALAAIRQPAAILIGAQDEMFVAENYPSRVLAANPRISVEVLPGIDHMGMTIKPVALERLTITAARLRDGIAAH